MFFLKEWGVTLQIENYSISPKILQAANEVERFQGLWEHTTGKFSSHLVTVLKQTTIITSSGSSTRIEGALMSDEEVEQLVKRNCKISEMSSRSEREVAGYVNTLRYIYNHYSELKMSEVNIRTLHQKLTSELLPGHLPEKQRGAYKDIPNNVIEKNEKTGEENVWFYTAPPGPQTEAEMESLITEYRELDKKNDVPKLILIAAFIVHFLAIHPFRDGNGRLSRLITTWLLLRAGYNWAQYTSHEKVIEDNKKRYYVSLRNTQNTFQKEKVDYGFWLEFFFLVLQKQVDYLKNKLTHESPEAGLSKNEASVYKLIQEYGTCTPSFILQHVDMTDNGLKTLLQRLVQRGLLSAIGKTKGRKYRIK